MSLTVKAISIGDTFIIAVFVMNRVFALNSPLTFTRKENVKDNCICIFKLINRLFVFLSQ